MSKKTVYVSSHYQAHEYAKEYKDYVVKHQHSKPVQDRHEKIQRIIINKTLRLSFEHLELLKTIQKEEMYNSESDFITALFSDMEVAIQESKIKAMCQYFGVEFELAHVNQHALKVDDDNLQIKMDNIFLDSKRFNGSVYVVNTHGKPGSIDGPYRQSFSKKDVQRIVFDACYSAALNCPKAGRKNKSFIQRVADEWQGRNKEKIIEFVGYRKAFEVDGVEITAKTLFSERKELDKENILEVITPEDRKVQLVALRRDSNDLSAQKKYKNTCIDADNEGAYKDNLVNVMIPLCSKYTKTFYFPLIKECKSFEYYNKAILSNLASKKSIDEFFLSKILCFLATTAGEHTIESILNEAKGNTKSIKGINKTRKPYLRCKTLQELVQLAEQTYKNLNSLVGKDNDTESSLVCLKSTIDDCKKFLSSDEKFEYRNSPLTSSLFVPVDTKDTGSSEPNSNSTFQQNC